MWVASLHHADLTHVLLFTHGGFASFLPTYMSSSWDSSVLKAREPYLCPAKV